MNLNEVVDLYNELSQGDMVELIKNDEIHDKINSLFNELKDCSDLARTTILSRINEEKAVRAMNMIQKLTVTLGIAEGESSLLLAEMAGELHSYTHTVILSFIGLLIKEEIL